MVAPLERCLFVQKKMTLVRKKHSEKRSRKRAFLCAVALNFIVFFYKYGYPQSTLHDTFLDFIPPYINIRSDLFISPKYNILACGIRKSMSQLLINIMCLLNNEQEFQRQNRSLNETWMSGRVCSHDDPKFHISQKSVLNSRNLTKFAFIRDPFDRFISFYLHICQNENGCWDCGGDMRCVLKNVYESLKKYEEDPDESKSTLVDRHAAPISWNCNFQEHISTYNLIKISTDAENRQSAIGELSALLADREISAHLITMISNGSLSGETLHGTHKSAARIVAEKQVREDTVVREYLQKIYFFDYLIFQFDNSHLDPEYRELLNEANRK